MTEANFAKPHAFIMNITICDRCNAQLQIPLIDEINLRQHQQSKSCKAIAAKVKASPSQPTITTLLRHVLVQVNARGMGITTTIYKRNAAMCSIVYLCKFVRSFILIINTASTSKVGSN